MAHRNRTVIFCLLIAAAWALFAQPAHATTVVRMNLEELAASSPSILHGTVQSAESKWSEDRSLIVTDVRIQVVTAVKGDAATEITIRQLGGVVGKLKVDVPGVALLHPGDEVVLFLAPASSGELHVNGLSQGRFDVVENAETGERTVRGLSTQQLGMLGMSPPAGVQSTRGQSLSLDAFLDGLRRVALEIRDAEGGR